MTFPSDPIKLTVPISREASDRLTVIAAKLHTSRGQLAALYIAAGVMLAGHRFARRDNRDDASWWHAELAAMYEAAATMRDQLRALAQEQNTGDDVEPQAG